MAEEVTSADIEALLNQETVVPAQIETSTHETSPIKPYLFPIVLGGLLVTVGLIAQFLLA